MVKGIEAGGEHAGILRLDFDPKEKKLESISWDEFFSKFDGGEISCIRIAPPTAP